MPQHRHNPIPPLAGPGYSGASLFWLADQPPTSRVGYSGAPQTISVMRRAVLDDANHFTTRQLAEEYGFLDLDGNMPDGAPDPGEPGPLVAPKEA